MSEQQPVEQRARKIIAEQLGAGVEQCTPEAAFVKDLGADSLDVVEMMMAMEDEFNVEIGEEEGETITTVGDAIALLETKLKQK